MFLDYLLTQTPLLYFTQSLWRDEAFSVLVAERPIHSFIGTLNFEPPVYYILLHLWIKIFGTSEIAVRSLSLMGLLLATCVVVLWSEHIFKKHWLSTATPFFFFFNPMLLYYGFEVRAYGVLMFFATLSLYAYSTKKYRLLTFANIFAFYTHSFAIFIPITQCVHYLLLHRQNKNFFNPKTLINDTVVRSFILWAITITPWMIIIAQEMAKARKGWYFPVDLQLVLSVLGNMFTSYDGTPGGHWLYTQLLSLALFILFILGIRTKKLRPETSYLFLAIFFPLTLVIAVSFIKPFFVNRYLIYVTIAQVLLISYAIYQIRHRFFQTFITALLVITIIGVNLYLPSRKTKLDIRATLLEANLIRKNNDVLYVTSPLIFFEAQYYTKDRKNVFLFNQQGYAFPWYVGDSIFDTKQMTNELPLYPKRAIIVGEDQSIAIQYRTSPAQKL